MISIVDLSHAFLSQLLFLWQGCILFNVFKTAQVKLIIQGPSKMTVIVNSESEHKWSKCQNYMNMCSRKHVH